MTLELTGLSVACVIGELPDERNRLQNLRIDVWIEIPEAAGHTDNLSDTIDYAALSRRIREVLVAAKCRMIERAARIVCDICLSDDRVSFARAKVTKSGAVEGLESASATLSVHRHGISVTA